MRGEDQFVIFVEVAQVLHFLHLALEDLNLTNVPVLHLTGNKAILSAEHANVAAGAVKERICDALATTGSNHVDLFFAGPASLALFLGHRLNTIAPVRCYERVSPGRYVPTCELQ